jgi:N-methylhydantoinase A
MGFDPDEVELDRAVDLRYVGQSYELSVPVSAPVDRESVAVAVDAFHDEHERLYGHAMRGDPVEAVTLRVTGRVPTPSMDDEYVPGGEDPHRGDREVYFDDEGYVDSSVFWRPALTVGESVEGPAILEGSGSTALVPPDATATVVDGGSIRIER